VRRSPPQLRKQLLAWLLVPLFVLLFIDSVFSYRVALEFSQRAYDRALVEVARDLSLHLHRESGVVTLNLPEEARRILLEDADDRIYYLVLDAGGRRIAGDAVLEPAVATPGPDASERFYDARIDGQPVRVVEVTVAAQGDRVAAKVRVAETTGRRTALAREILLAVVLPQALLLVVAGIVVWIGVVRGLAPLERVRRAVAARSHREWSPVAEEDVPGEVRPLLQEIDDLVARLDQALTVQVRFIADAAHQLKTPITVLKANLELALRDADPARAREALEAAHAGLDRLSRIVLQLLSLARNEPDATREVVLEPLDLGTIALEAASAWVPAALRRGIDLGFEGANDKATVRGDASRLRELLDNLIDNAVRYSAHGGKVTVRVAASPPAVHIDDDGPRIPPEERQRVFERFHRLLGNKEGGSGLGLAIATEIARIHGATIALDHDEDGVGNTFSVTFPAA
jgi:two-component system sensor histidine kinase TctE